MVVLDRKPPKKSPGCGVAGSQGVSLPALGSAFLWVSFILTSTLPLWTSPQTLDLPSVLSVTSGAREIILSTVPNKSPRAGSHWISLGPCLHVLELMGVARGVDGIDWPQEMRTGSPQP